MNTPAHALLNVAILSGGSRRNLAKAALGGSLLPDLPMYFFYLWVRGVEGLSDAQIWSETYFLPSWQLFFDLFNSIPLTLLGLGLANLTSASTRESLRVFFSSILLHLTADLLLHHDDGHRHFLPLSSWRFESPVSYWDPDHWGILGAGLEVFAVTISAFVLWRRFESRWVRGSVLLLSVPGAIAYIYFYWLR